MFDYTHTNPYVNGGLIETLHIGRPPRFTTMKIKTAGVDQIPVLLQQGELIVPKKHVVEVVKFLRHKKINLPNTKNIK
jgi:hypothetical protein